MDIGGILAKASQARVAVVGDICLDIYYFLASERTETSLETGNQTHAVREYRFGLGGAGNVAVNCKQLGASMVDVYGIVGSDPHGSVVLNHLRRANIGVAGVCLQGQHWNTHVYHKMYDANEEVDRYDIGNFNEPTSESRNAVIGTLEKNVERYDCVIVNEQVLYGMHDLEFQARLNQVIESTYPGLAWIVDCRSLNDVYSQCIHKLNVDEARTIHRRCSEHDDITSQPDEWQLVEWLHKHWRQPVAMTLGPDGALIHDGLSMESVAGLHLIGALDAVGAGDAFVSGLALSLATGASLIDSARIGNFSAAVCVQQLFETGHPTPEQVTQISEDPDFRYNARLAENPERAKYMDGTEIELIGTHTVRSFTGTTPAVAVFDHDGTISTLRRGWEDVMSEMMIRSIVGKKLSGLGGDDLERVTSIVTELIDNTTGVQTIVQMHELQKRVESIGYVPRDEVLSPEQYKKIYNDLLMEQVEVRRKALAEQRLTAEDLTIKGAIEFLRELHSAGVKLYLASGTDQNDVEREATLLGYAGLFEGRIFGSVGDIVNDPKRVVIRKILDGLATNDSAHGPRCVVFGDGPVEIRESRKRGLLSIGVISDERQRFGRNGKKRGRLVLAGADLLLPDFSWRDYLVRLMEWNL